MSYILMCFHYVTLCLCSSAADFKGFLVPVEASTTTATFSSVDAGVESPTLDEAAFLTRGQSVRRPIPLEDATVQVEESIRQVNILVNM